MIYLKIESIESAGELDVCDGMQSQAYFLQQLGEIWQCVWSCFYYVYYVVYNKLYIWSMLVGYILHSINFSFN